MKLRSQIVPAVLAMILWGCMGEARFKVAFEGEPKLRKDIKYDCATSSVEVKLGTNCYVAGDGWLITLRLKIKNDSEGVRYYCPAASDLRFESGDMFFPDSAAVGKDFMFMYRFAGVNRQLIQDDFCDSLYRYVISPKSEAICSVPFYIDHWPQDSTMRIVHFTPGTVTDSLGDMTCVLPGIYGDPAEVFFTPFR